VKNTRPRDLQEREVDVTRRADDAGVNGLTVLGRQRAQRHGGSGFVMQNDLDAPGAWVSAL
jgi:hypothetical protein